MSTKTESLTVRLGNANPQHNGTAAEHLDRSVTKVELWDGVYDDDFVDLTLSTDNDRVLKGIHAQLSSQHRKYAVAVHEVAQLWDVHSPGADPEWVDGDNKQLVKALADYFGCPVGEPTALLLTNGRDVLHDGFMTTGTRPATTNYMALTANATAPAAGDTVLTGEITTAGGGLVRALATYAHTAGTNTSTLTKTFTANGSDALPVTIAKIGAFNASSAGTLVFETLLAATATLSASGDNVTITDTVTAG